jgi:hypothetical protein
MIGMKTVYFFLVLGIQAVSCGAQTSSASLQKTAGSSALENSTPKLEVRIERAAGARTTFEFSNMPGASLPQLGVNLVLAKDSEAPSVTSQKLHYDFFLDRDTSSDPSTNPPHAEDPKATSTLVQPVQPPHPDTRIHWKAANGEALLSTGIMHTFNLWTEAGTRDALYGPWAKDWLQSVGELRGWSDSDQFMAPYVGHSIQGSIFGYILRQNDPKYRDVQWGDGRDYFMSLLRSMAFSAVWHTQW